MIISNLEKYKIYLDNGQLATFYLVFSDIVLTALSHFLALWLRFDCKYSEIDPTYLLIFFRSIWIYLLFCICIFYALRLYQSIWRFAGHTELLRLLVASGLTLVGHISFVIIFFGRMPLSYYVFGIALQFGFTTALRFGYRFVLLLRASQTERQLDRKRKHILVYGAGAAGRMIVRDIRLAKEVDDKVCCIIDDDPKKWRHYIDGIPIVGGRQQLMSAVSEYDIDNIYVAIPSAPLETRKEILELCSETRCKLMNIPGMYQIYNGEVNISSMRDVAIEDLLGREPIEVDMTEIYEEFRGKVILVTGGGGSIGSELCRQIAMHQPKCLVIFDIYENNAYNIQLELKKKYPDLNLKTVIGSVRDSRKIFHVMETYRPDIVYHAAAHKHVPLMEHSPCEAVKNNAIGTYKTAYAATVYGVKRFVLISTDKAVNPTNIMGASKRLCEMIIQAFDQKIKLGQAEAIPQLFTHWMDATVKDPQVERRLKCARTEFVAVRFGNVLGSNGSVIPLFKKQIEEGGPVTVTHPDIIRYFMTIPEAVRLVLLAGTYAKGGEIFVLDMGTPVKIDTLARTLIRLSGFKPDEDIKIVYTGLREGEKLYEEKLMAEEGLKKTKNELIHIGCPIPFDIEVFWGQLEELMYIAYRNDKEAIIENVQKMVSTFHPPNEEDVVE